ncbi:DUF962 domain-containing protein [Aliikangiella maris]|uniref:Mpo1-like protein n=2 Tax=Aliikangiella maris TaxID=3162458 RepID=A0ABV3MQ95_9GAMM
MKNLIEQLSTYKSVHFNPVNLKTHFVGIPLIILSTAVFLSQFQWQITIFNIQWHFSLTHLLFLVVTLYYAWLKLVLACGMILFIGLIIVLVDLLEVSAFAEIDWQIALGLFIVGWIFQFIGHRYEKAKPAFIDDLNQLFIGPLFLMAEIYFMLGWAPELEHKINQLAVTKRQQLSRLPK